MGWFSKSKEEVKEVKENTIICPYCEKPINKTIVEVADSIDEDNYNIIIRGCPNCKKLLGIHNEL